MYITLSQKITNELRQRILAGYFPPGYHLEEIPLSKELGSSRTPVRAALTSLLNMGLLEYLPKRGYVIAQFDEKVICDAYEVRANLEGMACSKVAEMGLQPQQIAHLEQQLEIGDRLLASGKLADADVERYRLMNVEFHQGIIDAAKNSWIARFVKDCFEIPLVSQRTIVWHDNHVMIRSHDDHHRILDALVRHEPSRAEYLMREHISFAGRFIQQNMHRVVAGKPGAAGKGRVAVKRQRVLLPQ